MRNIISLSKHNTINNNIKNNNYINISIENKKNHILIILKFRNVARQEVMII